MMLDMTRIYSLCFLFSSEIAGNKKPRSFYGAGLNKNLKLNCCDYAFLRRNAMSEARPPKPATAGVVGSETYSFPYAFRKSSRLMPD